VHFVVKITRQTGAEMFTKHPQTTIKTPQTASKKKFKPQKAFIFVHSVNAFCRLFLRFYLIYLY